MLNTPEKFLSFFSKLFLLSWQLQLLFRYNKGGYFFLPSYVMRTHGSRKQQEALRSISENQMLNVYKVCGVLLYLVFWNCMLIVNKKVSI